MSDSNQSSTKQGSLNDDPAKVPPVSMRAIAQDGLDWVGRLHLLAAIFVSPLITVLAGNLSQNAILFMCAFSTIAAFTFLWFAGRRSSMTRHTKIGLTFLLTAPLFISVGALIFQFLNLDWSRTDQEAIKYVIATEHELKAASPDSRLPYYYASNALLKYHDVRDDGKDYHLVYRGLDDSPGRSLPTIADYYTNQYQQRYFWNQHRKEFVIPPQLSRGRTKAVAMTRTWFRRHEKDERTWKKYSDLNQEDKYEVFVLVPFGRGGIIQPPCYDFGCHACIAKQGKHAELRGPCPIENNVVATTILAMLTF